MKHSEQAFNYEESFGVWGKNPKKYRYISHEPLLVGDLVYIRHQNEPKVITSVVTTEDKGNWTKTITHKLPDGRIDYRERGEKYVVYSNIITI